MKKKNVVIIGVVIICLGVGLFLLSSVLDKMKCKSIVESTIDARIEEIKEKENYSDLDINYTIDKIEKAYLSDNMIVTITYNVNTNKSIDEYEYTELVEIKEVIGNLFSSAENGKNEIKVHGQTKADTLRYSHYTINMNGEEIFSGYKSATEFKEQINKNQDNHSSEAIQCKSCGRYFEPGDSAGNYMNIAKTGMCNNCYGNFQWGQSAIGN